MTVWIKPDMPEHTHAVVLATLADRLLADLADSDMEGEDLTQMSRRQLTEALDEFYALHPHLGVYRRAKVPA